VQVFEYRIYSIVSRVDSNPHAYIRYVLSNYPLLKTCDSFPDILLIIHLTTHRRQVTLKIALIIKKFCKNLARKLSAYLPSIRNTTRCKQQGSRTASVKTVSWSKHKSMT